MTRVGAFEAKTHLSRLLSRVAGGEKFVITRRGRPVAVLASPEIATKASVKDIVSEMLRRRDTSGPRLGNDLTVRQLRTEGQR